MSELLPFCKIKLQYLLEMVTDHELDDNALRVALCLALARADHETGERPWGANSSMRSSRARVRSKKLSWPRPARRPDASFSAPAATVTNVEYQGATVSVTATTQAGEEVLALVPEEQFFNAPKSPGDAVTLAWNEELLHRLQA